MPASNYLNQLAQQSALKESLNRLTTLTKTLVSHAEQSPKVTSQALGLGLYGIIGNHFNEESNCIEMGYDFSFNSHFQCAMLLKTSIKDPQKWTFCINDEEMYAKNVGDRTYSKDSDAWKTGQPPVALDGAWTPVGKACDIRVEPILQKIIAQLLTEIEPLEKKIFDPQFIKDARMEKAALLGLELVASLEPDMPTPKKASDSDNAAFNAMMGNLKSKKPGL